MSNRFIKRRFLSLIDKYLKGESTPEQKKLIDNFYDSIRDEEIPESKLSSVEVDIRSSIHQRIQEENAGKVIAIRRYPYLKIASCIALLAVSSFFTYNYFSDPQTQTITEALKKSSAGEDYPVIVLNDGKSYKLRGSQDSPAAELQGLEYKIINDEKVFIVSENLMSAAGQKLDKIKNPTSKIFAFLLHDGTTAWLNPNSTLEILPVANNKRRVKVEGTVLFDVQKIRKDNGYMPFVVQTALQTIEVLGTRFVVNSTSNTNEDVLLIEGKVKLIHNTYHTEVILHPDQKASLKSTEPQILITKSSDSYKVEAWHKGLFAFENEKMSEVMAEVSQWYGKNIIVDQSIKDIPITGMISRYKDIDEVLEIIEMTNNVSYKKSGGNIYIK